MTVDAVLNQMVILFLLMAVGFLCGKLRIIDQITNKRLSNIVANVTQVAMILSAVITVEERMAWGEFGVLILAGCGMYLLLCILSFVSSMPLRAPKEDLGTYRFMMIFGNVGFMGFPVVASFFGSGAVFYAAMFNLPFNILVYSIGVIMLSGGGKAKLSWKTMVNAPLIAALAAVLIYIVRIPFPPVVVDAVVMLGDTTVPLAMLIIGSSLAMIPLKKVFSEWRLYPVIFIKLIVAPILLRLIFGGIISNELIMGISFVMAAMPVAANSTLLTNMFGGNESLASRGVFISTALSVVTIPLMIYLFPL